MAYQVVWIVENQVLYMLYEGDVSLADIAASTRVSADYIQQAYRYSPSSMVIGIVDLREAKLHQIMRSALTAAVGKVADVIDPRIMKAKPGFVVLVTASDAAKRIISLIVRLYAQPMTTVAELDEALTVVRHMYPELEPHLERYKNNPSSTDVAGEGP